MYVPNDSIQVEADGPVRILKFNRPEIRNAVSADIKEALKVVWDNLADDLDVAAVVLTGNGPAFSAGGDIADFARVTADGEYRRRIRLRHAKQIIDAMVNFPLPVVVAVNGPAVGLGCSLASLGDIILAGESAMFADPHVSIGLVAGDGGAAIWPLMMSLAKAKEYILTGDPIPAEEAYRIGLVNHVYPDADLLPKAIELAHRLAKQPRPALQETKKIMNMHVARASFGILETALSAESESFTTDEHREKVEAFLARANRKTAERSNSNGAPAGKG
jgi:enoyl-CoA hydratase